jgi:hypothetical protein
MSLTPYAIKCLIGLSWGRGKPDGVAAVGLTELALTRFSSKCAMSASEKFTTPDYWSYIWVG